VLRTWEKRAATGVKRDPISRSWIWPRLAIQDADKKARSASPRIPGACDRARWKLQRSRDVRARAVLAPVESRCRADGQRADRVWRTPAGRARWIHFRRVSRARACRSNSAGRSTSSAEDVIPAL
jgi:hypothetical protein